MVSETVSPTEQFLSVLERTLLCVKTEAERVSWVNVGRKRLFQIVDKFVLSQQPIQMVLPAFPFKSPNNVAKVLGTDPDAGEEVALKRLDDLCCKIDLFYPPGAHMVIFSDGRVFNDLLGVDDALVHNYNVKCKEIVERNNLKHISFDSLENYVSDEDLKKGNERLIDIIAKQYLDPSFDVNVAIQTKEDIKNTYLGFRSFLHLDLNLRWSKCDETGVPLTNKKVDNQCKIIAKQMIVRNQAFAALVSAKYPDHVRWSIHSGNLQGPKFSVSLINTSPNSSLCASATPWHNVLLETLNGDVFALRLADVDHSKYSLVFRDGQPWGFKEIASSPPLSSSPSSSSFLSSSPLPACHIRECSSKPPVDGAEKEKEREAKEGKEEEEEEVVDQKTREEWKDYPVTFKKLEPFGVMIIASPFCASPPLHVLPKESLRGLVLKHSTLVLRGFSKMSKDDFVEGTRRFGPLVSNPHGFITDVKEVDDPKISVFTREAMPVHFDGMFRIKKGTENQAEIPFLQIFQCVTPPAPTDEGGITVFIDTRKMLAEAFDKDEIERLRNINIGYYMPPSGMFGGKWMHFDVIAKHPISGVDIIRTHEPWSETKSEKFSILAKATKEEEAQEVQQFFDKISSLFYDDRFAYKHNWEKHDILFADNHSQLHTRTAYKTASRHLRRLHIQE